MAPDELALDTDASTPRTAAYSTPRPDVAALVPSSAERVLDLGCGRGAFGAALRSSGRYVAGVEADPEAATVASDQLDAAHCLDLSDPEWVDTFAGQQFDVVVAADVLEHLPQPETALSAATTLLSPTGSVIVSIPNIRHISALASVAVQGRFPRRDRGIFDDTHLRWFTWRDVLALHQSAGLQPDEWSTNVRVTDQPGGALNERAERLLGRWRQRGPIREFLAYQFVVRSHLSA